MRTENIFNSAPLRMIRIVKCITVDEMANCFKVSKHYINYIESGAAININIHTLNYGLNNLGITIDQYNEIVEFRKLLNEKQLEYKEKYKCMLLKTVGVFTPEIKEQIDEMLNNVLLSKTK